MLFFGMYVCMYVYLGTCITMQNSETVNNGYEKRRHVTKAITRMQGMQENKTVKHVHTGFS